MNCVHVSQSHSCKHTSQQITKRRDFSVFAQLVQSRRRQTHRNVVISSNILKDPQFLRQCFRKYICLHEQGKQMFLGPYGEGILSFKIHFFNQKLRRGFEKYIVSEILVLNIRSSNIYSTNIAILNIKLSFTYLQLSKLLTSLLLLYFKKHKFVVAREH